MVSISLPQMKYPKGIVLYHGPSVLNPKEKVVCIATGFQRKTKNPKTGDMIQTWILPANKNPCNAYFDGEDTAVCGNCKHRSKTSGGLGTCYVPVHQAPYMVWEAWKRGSYDNPTLGSLAYFKNRNLRIGSYGDPAVIPFEVWDTITQEVNNWVGYTHQFNNAKTDKRLKNIIMASVDSERERELAVSRGWRTFRIRTPNSELMDKEFVCPASKEAGHRLTCVECNACRGGENDGKKGTVAIIIHGRGYKQKWFIKAYEAYKQKKGWNYHVK